MTVRLALFLLLFLPFVNESISQTEGDSLRLIWQNETAHDSVRFDAIVKYYEAYTFSQPDSSFVVADYHYALAKQKKASKQMVIALCEKSEIASVMGEVRNSMEYLNEAVMLLTKLNEPINVARIYGNMANTYIDQSNYQEGIRHYSYALKIFKEHKVENEEAVLLNNLADVYKEIGNYDLALECLNNAILINERLNETDNLAYNFFNVGAVSLAQEKYGEAITNVEKALPHFQTENNLFAQTECYFLLAKSHQKLGDRDRAYLFGEKSLILDKELANEPNIIERLTFLANRDFETNVNLATVKGEAILNRLQPETRKELKEGVYQLLYKCYKSKGIVNKALEMHELYTIYSDSTKLEKNNFAVVREAVKNEFEIKLYETELENEKAQAQLKLRQLKRIFAIVLAAVALIAIVVLYFRSNIKKNRKKRDALLEELEQLKNKANSNLVLEVTKYELVRGKIERSIERKLNETDWIVLNILIEDPVIPNKKIAEKAFMSVEGISSSLRRMYDYFEISDSKYKKIALLTDAIKRSNSK